ncbi:MAG: putative ABC transporter permease [bacterium]
MDAMLDFIFLFYAFSVIGWVIEVVGKLVELRRFVNRGFLTGPWLPIYGFGAVVITLSVNALRPYEFGYFSTFFISFILCGVLEYLSSYFMELIFHARWWDYSTKPMNLNGRIWIGNLILFGLAGIAVIHFADPFLLSLIARLGAKVKLVLIVVLSVIFLTDFILTQFILKLVKTGVERSRADNTEEIGKEIRHLLSDRSIFYRRFADAYPEVTYRTKAVLRRMEAVKEETERLRREAESRVASAREKLEAEKDKLTERWK